MAVLKTNFNGNPNVGLYGFATDSYCLIGKGLKRSLIKQIGEVLKVPVYEITINHSNLIGVYCCGTKDSLFVPELIKEDEEKELKIKYKKIKTKFSALGNNIVLKGNNALVNPEFEENIKSQLEGFKVESLTVDGHKVIGSCVIVNDHGCLVNMNIDEKELKKIEKKMGVRTEVGSVNKGNPYVRSGIICNSNGYIIGGETTGMEVMRIEEVLKK
jgi:translation initiation factor 6